MTFTMSTLSSDWAVVVLAVICLAISSPVLYKKLYGICMASGSSGLSLPPGPKGWPIFGMFYCFPKYCLWEWAAEQAKTYGSLMSIRVIGKPILFVNSYTDANELLVKKSAKYSSRANLVFARELQGWDWLPAFMPYSDELRNRRAVMNRFIQPTAMTNFIPIQTQEIHTLLKSILDNPREFDKHVRRFPGAVILMAAYGHKVTNENDPLIVLVEEGIQRLTESEQLCMVEFLPWLKYIPEFFPGAEFKKRAREGYATARAILTKPYAEAKRRIFEGKGSPCMVSQLLDENMNMDGSIRDEEVIASSAGMLYGAGQDTIRTTIMTAILALTLYPDVQRKAQEEVDRVIGKDTLPTFQDRTLLPYINAVCTEALRWNAAAPLGVPHASTVDDNHNGYFIPEGTVIYPNVWAMSRNEAEYPNPEEFKPERYLPGEGKVPAMDPGNFVFGFGRRICPGRGLAQASVFLAVSSILAAFNVNKTIDANGNAIEPKAVYTPTSVRIMKRFECSMVPRNSKMIELIQQLNLSTVHA